MVTLWPLGYVWIINIFLSLRFGPLFIPLVFLLRGINDTGYWLRKKRFSWYPLRVSFARDNGCAKKDFLCEA